MIKVTDSFREMILVLPLLFYQQAIEQGMRTLREDGHARSLMVKALWKKFGIYLKT